MGIWNVYVWIFGKFCGHFAHFSGFGTLNKEKSGTPVLDKLFCLFTAKVPFRREMH
jgi:hypothetical protein